MAERDDDLPVLEYRVPPRAVPPPSPLVAALLCVPSLLCWTSLFGHLLGHSLIDPAVLFLLGVLAWTTGVFSVFYYNTKRRARATQWYVILAIFVCISGLAYGPIWLLLAG